MIVGLIWVVVGSALLLVPGVATTALGFYLMVHGVHRIATIMPPQ